MSTTQARVHHYVPQWYQRRFLHPGQSKFYYLDLHPETITRGKVKYERNALLRWGPPSCFCMRDLYTLKLGNWSTDDFEKRFFGAIDNHGKDAVELFSDYSGVRKGLDLHKAFQVLPLYMDAQRFRTPRGLDFLLATIDVGDHNLMLLAMQKLYRFHTTMWMEGIWEFVRARQSSTKFICTDEPVSFFNRKGFPSEFPYPKDVGVAQVGTRTLFPLSMDCCLIITHLQLCRNPWINPTTERENARAYQNTLKNFLDTQFGRELEEQEVLRVNYILKRRATRYIAAAEEAWLYPERHVSVKEWAKLDEDWFLLPNLYKIPFHAEIIVGYKDGSVWGMDEYGRQPGNPKFKDEKLHAKEWISHQRAERDWARKRKGKSVAHVDKFEHDDVHDKIMLDDLAKMGLDDAQVAKG
jgi:Protein of unknown function (DUF4238)